MRRNVLMKMLDPNAINVLEKMDDTEVRHFEREIAKVVHEMIKSGAERGATKGFHIINMVVETQVYNIQMFVDVKDTENVCVDVMSLSLLNMDEFLDFLSEFKTMENATNNDKKEFFLKCLRDLS